MADIKYLDFFVNQKKIVNELQSQIDKKFEKINPSEHINVVIKSQYGSYCWCGNNYDGEHSGYYLSSSCKCELYKLKHFMLYIKVSISDELLKMTDIIEIYDSTGFLAQYHADVPLMTSTKEFFFSVDEKLIDTELYIKCRKIVRLKKPEGVFIGRVPMVTVLQKSVIIPQILLRGDKKCSICLDEITDDDKYISRCGHNFHSSCIFKYLEKINKLKPLTSHCSKYCEHSEKVLPFPCPICRTLLEKQINT